MLALIYVTFGAMTLSAIVGNKKVTIITTAAAIAMCLLNLKLNS